ncbi:MAG: hypothetical protein QW230_01280 [Thermofilum sp.]
MRAEENTVDISCEELLDAFLLAFDDLLSIVLEEPVSPWRVRIPFPIISSVLFTLEKESEMKLTLCSKFFIDTQPHAEKKFSTVEVHLASDLFGDLDDSYFVVVLRNGKEVVLTASQLNGMADLAFIIVLWDKLRRVGFDFIEEMEKRMAEKRKQLEKAEESLKRLLALLQVVLL